MPNRADELRRRLAVLELEPGASWADVRAKFRFLAKVWHPDRFSDRDPARSEAEARFKSVNDAYSWLSANREALVAAAREAGARESNRDGSRRGGRSDAADSADSADAAEERSRRSGTGAASHPKRRFEPRLRFDLSFGALWPLALAAAFALVVLLGLRRLDTGPPPWGGGWEAPPAAPTPAAGAPGLESAAPARAAALLPVAPDLSHLTDDERRAAEHSCNGTKIAFGLTSYYACLEQQVAGLARSPGMPDLSALTVEQRLDAEIDCRGTKLTVGPAAYYDCLRYQTLGMRTGP